MSPPRQHSFIAQAVIFFINIFNTRLKKIEVFFFQDLLNLLVRSVALKWPRLVLDKKCFLNTSRFCNFLFISENDILKPWEARRASSWNVKITLCGNPPKVPLPYRMKSVWGSVRRLENLCETCKPLISPEVIFRHISNPSIVYVEALFMILKVLWPFEGTVMDA